LYFVFATSGAWSQQTVQVTPRSATTPAPKFAKSPLTTLQKGTVVDNTYRNPSLGLEITPAPDLKLGPPEIKGNPGTVPLLVTVAAWGDRKWFSEGNRMAFYADALDYYPSDKRSTEAYVARVGRAQISAGFELTKTTPDQKFGGTSFARTDFKQDSVYEAVLVKACDFYAYVFIFAGADKEAVDKSILGTALKLQPQESGCESKKGDGATK
jgi:hypothetical protein